MVIGASFKMNPGFESMACLYFFKVSEMKVYLVDGLASDAGVGIDVVVSHGLGVRVGNPRHLPLASSHIGGGHVNRGACNATSNIVTNDVTPLC